MLYEIGHDKLARNAHAHRASQFGGADLAEEDCIRLIGEGVNPTPLLQLGAVFLARGHLQFGTGDDQIEVFARH